MCGIMGYTGMGEALPPLLEGLRRLEYRGYDSAGIALLTEEVTTIKASGRLFRLVEKVKREEGASTGIGHTRWATHGAPSDVNAHPHTDTEATVAVVHNGIIENYESLKEGLIRKGVVFRSETDSEVVPHLLSQYRKEGLDPIASVERLSHVLSGSYALAILFRDRPQRIYALRAGSPLYLGIGVDATYLASDTLALSGYAHAYQALPEGVTGVLTPAGFSLFGEGGIYQESITLPMPEGERDTGMGGYSTYMEKEIHEVPSAIQKTTRGMRDIPVPKGRVVYLVGCGSAYHAALVGEMLLSKEGIVARAMIASEFRYRDLPLGRDTPVILISQSGETADTLAALRRAKEAGAPTYAIVNVAESAMAREADTLIRTQAGKEVAVATTKAYCAQVAALLRWFLDDMPTKVSTATQEALTVSLGNIVPYLTARAHAFFIGRGIDAAAAREGCLKLKEVSYLHAESYAAGELKHGTISLIEAGTPVIAILTDPNLVKKTLSGVEEVRARGGRVWLVACEGLVPKGEDTILVPSLPPPCSILPVAVVLERVALGVARARGYDPDKPRNLAKSVTVE